MKINIIILYIIKKNIDNFLEIVDIKHEKGNIKFYCFNFHAYAGLKESDV